MPGPNAEIVRTLIPPAEADVAALLRDDELFQRMQEALAGFIDAEVEAVALWQPGETRTYTGLDGFRTLWLDWLEPWTTYHVRVERLVDLGERVVALVRDVAKRHDSDAEFEIAAGSVWTFRGGRLVRAEFCTREQALEVAGEAPD